MNLELTHVTHSYFNESNWNSPICPVSLLWLRSNITNDGKVYNQDGIVSLNKLKLWEKPNSWRFVRFPIDGGSCPLKLFLEIDNEIKFLRLLKTLGILPLKWFPLRCNKVICVSFSSEAGMDLENSENLIFKVCKDFRLPIEVGMDLKNLQLERSKVFKDFRLPIEVGSSPQKFVCDKNNTIRELLSLNSGKFPLRLTFPSKLRTSSFGRWMSWSRNLPCNPQSKRCNDIKEDRFSKELGKNEEMDIPPRWSFYSLVKFWTRELKSCETNSAL